MWEYVGPGKPPFLFAFQDGLNLKMTPTDTMNQT